MRRYSRSVLLSAVILVLAVGPVHAGGLWLTQQPTPDMGVGSAGNQATGFDASTATANPAAMTRLDRSQMEAGIMGLYVDSKFNVQNASITTLAFNPTIGYKIAPWLSIGGGVSVVEGKLGERVAVNTLAEPGDGRLKYDASDVGFGYNLGVLFELSPQTRVGVTYVSQVDLKFKDENRHDHP